MIDPREDGITHINIYSKGMTQLGRYMSNWDRCYVTTELGEFASIEGLIFYMGSFDPELKNLSGFEAKEYGEKADRGIRLPNDIFKRIIVDAMENKILCNNHLHSLLKQSTLPFTHYYTYGNKVIEIPKWQWQVAEWDIIRKELQIG